MRQTDRLPGTCRKLSVVVLMLPLIFASIHAQDAAEYQCTGKIVDTLQRPAVGYRVVYRVVGGTGVSISQPTDDDGEYSVMLPDEAPCEPIAVISPGGKRIELGEQDPVAKGEDVRRDLKLEIMLPRDESDLWRWAYGSDRLQLSFVEDTATTDNQRWEVQLELADLGDDRDVRVSRAIAAFAIDQLPGVELGARLGYGAVDNPDGLADESGITDLDLWGKLRVATAENNRREYAVGAIVTLPTGDQDPGFGYDGLRSKIFMAGRWFVGSVGLTANLGVRFNEDGETESGVPLSGEIAPAVGIGMTLPVWRNVALLFEGTYEGERFESFDPDARVLVGMNWKPFDAGTFRLGFAAGVDDGAPDGQILVGYAFDF
ncbi:MAG: hypothetical protein GY716_16370 [bacterium]|nr:hypothetical protein [bacterium]